MSFAKPIFACLCTTQRRGSSTSRHH